MQKDTKQAVQSAIVSQLLKTPEQTAANIQTVETVEVVQQAVVEHWKGLPDSDSPEAKACAVAYAKLMIRKKQLAGQPAKIKGVGGKAQEVFEQAKELLSMGVSDIAPIVKVNAACTLVDVLHVGFAVRRNMILQKYASQLPEDELAAFTEILDSKIASKIKARLEGHQAPMYAQAFQEACAKYGVTAGKEPEVPTGAAPVVKPKKKKKAAPPAVSTFLGVKDAMVTIPKQFPMGLGGATLSLVSNQVMDLLNDYMEDERKRWASQGVECSDILLRHNFLTLVVNQPAEGDVIDYEGTQIKIGATAVDPEQPVGAALWVVGEQFN